MRAVIKDIKTFKDILQLNKDVVDNMVITCDSDGLSYNLMDRSHVCFVGGMLSKKFFQDYECENPSLISVDTGALMDILKRIGNKGTLYISNDETSLTFKHIDKSTRKFILPQIDIEYNDLKAPDIKYPVSFDIDIKEWSEYLKDAEAYSDKVSLVIYMNEFHMCAEGVFGKYESTYDLKDDVIEKDYCSKFNIGKLKSYNVKFSDTVNVNMGDEMPVMLKSENEENTVAAFMMVAPIIEAD